MPIITVQTIKGVVLTTDEQKRELLRRMTDTFIDVVGEVARPYTYCIINETPTYEWSIAGKPLPDLAFLYGPDYAAMHQRANGLMRAYVENSQPEAQSPAEKAEHAERVWRGDVPATTSAEDTHKAIFQRWFEEAWNKGNFDVADELIDPNFSVHGAGGQAVQTGVEGVKDLVRTWRTAFPDGQMTVDDVIAEGDKVVARLTWRGTHRGDFYGLAATGKSVVATSIGIDRFANGKIVEGWGEVDMLGMMRQLGAIPAPGAGGNA
jgi:steroid delta-isomerase-like uncharacterized protein/4-oxalocrotonate tautomerase family enzyme